MNSWQRDFGWEIPGGRRVGGSLRVPGDKSISHRAAILASLAAGRSHLHGFLTGEDTVNTARAMAALGARITGLSTPEMEIEGVGAAGLTTPRHDLDMGNAGTGIRLLTGVVAGQQVACSLTGDASLCSRPMGRILKPLRAMGARIEAEGAGDRAPLVVRPAGLTGIDYPSPIASAQVKSCVLLAGLGAHGRTAVHEPAPSRDHTERILPAFGVDVERLADGAALTGGQRLTPCDLTIPGDLSSAAFFLVGAALSAGSTLTVAGVGVNPTRTGVVDCLRAMGARVERVAERQEGGEPVADLVVTGGDLTGIEIGGTLMVRAIDEFPILAVAACFADGDTTFRDAAELRMKESDRIRAMAAALRAIGGEVEERPDGMIVHGRPLLPGGQIDSHGDHRVAMALAIAASRCTGPVAIRNTACVDTSFPGFLRLLAEATG